MSTRFIVLDTIAKSYYQKYKMKTLLICLTDGALTTGAMSPAELFVFSRLSLAAGLENDLKMSDWFRLRDIVLAVVFVSCLLADCDFTSTLGDGSFSSSSAFLAPRVPPSPPSLLITFSLETSCDWLILGFIVCSVLKD